VNLWRAFLGKFFSESFQPLFAPRYKDKLKAFGSKVPGIFFPNSRRGPRNQCTRAVGFEKRIQVISFLSRFRLIDR